MEYTTFCLQLIWTAQVVIMLKSNIGPAEKAYCTVAFSEEEEKGRNEPSETNIHQCHNTDVASGTETLPGSW